MSKDKMVKTSPVPAKPEKSPLERMTDLTRRIVAVPKMELLAKRTPKKKGH
jgi:hypothetical protein